MMTTKKNVERHALSLILCHMIVTQNTVFTKVSKSDCYSDVYHSNKFYVIS